MKQLQCVQSSDKKHFYEKPTYHNLSVALRSLKSIPLQQQITVIALLKLGCGLDGLREDTVYRLIHEIQVNSDLLSSVEHAFVVPRMCSLLIVSKTSIRDTSAFPLRRKVYM